MFMYNRKYAEAERIFKEVQATDPKNQRSHYYLGRLYVRWGKLDAALASLTTYLAFTDLSDAHRGYALYYKGQVHYRKKQLDQAEAAWKQAWKVGKIKRAKTRLEKLEERRAAGKSGKAG